MNIILLVAVLAIALLAAAFACVRIWERSHTQSAVNIGEGTHKESVTKLASAAITTRYLILKQGADANHVAVCTGTTDVPIGVATDEPAAAEDPVDVALLGARCQTLRVRVGTVAIAAGALVATDANACAQTAVATQYPIGRAITAGVAGGIVEVDPVVPTLALV
jgi:hypothetical protein